MGSRLVAIELTRRTTRTNARGAAMSQPQRLRRLVSPAHLRNLSRLFNDRSLRTKLILGFLAVALLSVGGVALLSSRATQEALTKQVGENLHSLASSRAHALGDELDRQ